MIAFNTQIMIVRNLQFYNIYKVPVTVAFTQIYKKITLSNITGFQTKIVLYFSVAILQLQKL